MSHKIMPQRQKTAVRPFLLVGSIIAVFVALGLVLSSRTIPTPPPEQAAAPHFVDTAEGDHHTIASRRTVIVAGPDETLPGISSETGPLMATLVRGTYPEGVTEAIVRTDENCAPDQEGISHCLNELDFGNIQIVVQHHHPMATTPCLTPGETVNVITVRQLNAQS